MTPGSGPRARVDSSSSPASRWRRAACPRRLPPATRRGLTSGPWVPAPPSSTAWTVWRRDLGPPSAVLVTGLAGRLRARISGRATSWWAIPWSRPGGGVDGRRGDPRLRARAVRALDAAGLRYRVGPLLTVDEVVTTPAAKAAWLAGRTARWPSTWRARTCSPGPAAPAFRRWRSGPSPMVRTTRCRAELLRDAGGGRPGAPSRRGRRRPPRARRARPGGSAGGRAARSKASRGSSTLSWIIRASPEAPRRAPRRRPPRAARAGGGARPPTPSSLCRRSTPIRTRARPTGSCRSGCSRTRTAGSGASSRRP